MNLRWDIFYSSFKFPFVYVNYKICNAKLQGKLELLTGGNPATMTVQVYDKNDKLVCKLEEGQRLLGSYPLDDGMRIHVYYNISLNLIEALQIFKKLKLWL